MDVAQGELLGWPGQWPSPASQGAFNCVSASQICEQLHQQVGSQEDEVLQSRSLLEGERAGAPAER